MIGIMGKSNAQFSFLKNDHDTNYIYSATEKLTTRLIAPVSYTDVSFYDRDVNKSLSYSIHSKLNFGIGFNYSIFGINLSLSPFTNPDNDEKYGKTRSIDLRMNLYGSNLIFDLYLINHKGFYLSNPFAIIEGWIEDDTYPKRPDINVFSTGIVSQYIFNSKKFSLRATYLQNEWQKKSAGSFIVGGEIFYSLMSADSSIIPTNVDPPDFMNGKDFNHSSSLNLGINCGYSHTFVVRKHFFFSLGLSAGPQISYSVLKYTIENTVDKNITFGLNGLLRTGIGYNSKKIYVGMFFISENLMHITTVKKTTSLLSIGIVKLNLVYRFTLKKPIKLLNPNYWNFLQKK